MKGEGREEGIIEDGWTERERDDIKETGLSGEEVYDRATSTPHKSGNNMKKTHVK